MNNILFFLTPKAMCAFVYDDFTIRQALEKMESAGYAALPILNKRGEYRGTITEGDLLWALKNMCYMDIRQAEASPTGTRIFLQQYGQIAKYLDSSWTSSCGIPESS